MSSSSKHSTEILFFFFSLIKVNFVFPPCQKRVFLDSQSELGGVLFTCLKNFTLNSGQHGQKVIL